MDSWSKRIFASVDVIFLIVQAAGRTSKGNVFCRPRRRWYGNWPSRPEKSLPGRITQRFLSFIFTNIFNLLYVHFLIKLFVLVVAGPVDDCDQPLPSDACELVSFCIGRRRWPAGSLYGGVDESGGTCDKPSIRCRFGRVRLLGLDGAVFDRAWASCRSRSTTKNVKTKGEWRRINSSASSGTD